MKQMHVSVNIIIPVGGILECVLAQMLLLQREWGKTSNYLQKSLSSCCSSAFRHDNILVLLCDG